MRRPCAAGINTAGRLSYTMFTSAVCTLELDVYGGKKTANVLSLVLRSIFVLMMTISDRRVRTEKYEDISRALRQLQILPT